MGLAEMESRYDRSKHYEIEKALASKLKNASKDERKVLYGQLYDDLFKLVPDHPMLSKKANPEARQKELGEQLNYLKKYLTKNAVFVEVGSGDCAFSFEVAKYVKKVYGVDVSEVISENKDTPENFELALSDGTSIPIPEEGADIIYSNQLMEHLHPDDARQQLQNIYDALKEGGIYFCQTPNVMNGPHDVSSGFDERATCFHLKEYTVTDLSNLFKEIGFRKIQCIIGAKGLFLTIPAFPVKVVEKLISFLPYKVYNPLARSKLLNAILDIRMIGHK